MARFTLTLRRLRSAVLSGGFGPLGSATVLGQVHDLGDYPALAKTRQASARSGHAVRFAG